MNVVTVNIAFSKQLLRRMDSVAKKESRSRSELLREAARIYIERKHRWEKISSFWKQEARRRGYEPGDVETWIAEHRRRQANNP